MRPAAESADAALALYVPHAPSAPPAPPPSTLVTPRYLEQTYWWAYVHPHAVSVFERDWLVNLILFGNYGRLRDAAIAALAGPGRSVAGRTLQVACAYGNLTAQLQRRLAADAALNVVDILPIQLRNLAGKLPADERIRLLRGDSAALADADASYDQVLMFFLLHEQPEPVRRATLAEALRVLKPGGRLVIVDYHRPASLHPLRLLMRAVFRWLEPYAMDLWNHQIVDYLPAGFTLAGIDKQTSFGGLYQKLVLTR